MIGKDEIESMAESMAIDTSYVQRDYVHGWVLSRLYGQSRLANRLILKGGNSLRKAYFENARYSRDLDFTTSIGISLDELHSELNGICESVASNTGIEFDTERTMVRDKKGADRDKTIAEARIYFKDFYGNESKLVLAVRLDVSQFDRMYLPVQQRNLLHPYSDIGACSTQIKCVKLEEVLASKMRCLLQRRNIGDLFDLVYATMINSDIDINRPELVSTFFRITIFRSRPSVAKGLLVALPFDSMKEVWDKYIACPVSSWFEFGRAKDSFLELMDALIPGLAEGHYDPVFFPASLRNPILEAAETRTLLRLTYDGRERLVEPYELAFKIRKDGVAREYFYVYDQTGGVSSGPGIKTFVSSKVRDLENTDISFEPRVEIELNKAGGSETVSRFEGKRGVRRSVFGATRRLRKSRRKRASYSGLSSGYSYRVECPYCGKRFSRKKADTKLNPHKDKYGNKCYGKRGFLV